MVMVLALAKAVEADDRSIEERFFSGEEHPATYLSRASFVSLLETLASSKDYSSVVRRLQFQEIYKRHNVDIVGFWTNADAEEEFTQTRMSVPL